MYIHLYICTHIYYLVINLLGQKKEKISRIEFRCTENYRSELKQKVEDRKTDMSKYIRQAIDTFELLHTGYLQYDNMYKDLMKDIYIIINGAEGKQRLREIIKENLDINTIMDLNTKLGLE